VGEARGTNVNAIDPVANGCEAIGTREGWSWLVSRGESSHSRVRDEEGRVYVGDRVGM